MKKYLLLFGLLGALNTQAQNSRIVFANDASSLISNALTGALVQPADNIKVQLYVSSPGGGTNEDDLVLMGETASVGSPVGRYAGPDVLLPGVTPGTPVNIQVRAFESTFGDSYGQAEAGLSVTNTERPCALLGKSAITTVITGDPSGAEAGHARMVGPLTVNELRFGPYLRVNDIVVAEGSNGVVNAAFTFTWNRELANPIIVAARTLDGTALEGEDFISTNVVLYFIPGQSRRTFLVHVTADAGPEADETFYLMVSRGVGSGGIILTPRASCLITEVRVTDLSVDTSVSFNTVPDRRYAVEKSTDGQNWTPVNGATDVLGTGGIVTIIDHASGCNPTALYRSKLVLE